MVAVGAALAIGVGTAVAATSVVPEPQSTATGAPTTPAAGEATVPGPGPNATSSPAPTTATGVPPEARRPDRPAGAPTFSVPDPAPPVEVEVPSIGVRSTLVDLHLDGQGALEAPTDYGTAGWFVDGPQPGQPGPAVVAGHVDSKDGPAVFYRLADMAVGDEVIVSRQDADPARFAVTRVEQYPKDAFPTAAVYGPVPGPELRLITCGGTFDRRAGSYRDNVVVYATALPP